MLITTIITFIVILGILVFVHELGHFITAKRAGIRVDEFGFGFPPRIYGIKRGETLYSINAIPLGGFVQMYGEQGEGKTDPRSFAAKPVLTRAIILASGVIMNFITAVFFLTAAHLGGLPIAISDEDVGNYNNVKIQISMVNPNSPADLAGLKMGDTILEMETENSIMIPYKIKDVQEFNNQYAGTEIALKIQRGEQIFQTKAISRKDTAPDEGHLGVALARTATVSSWHQAAEVSIYSALFLVFYIFTELWKIIQGLFGGAPAGMELAGPVGIAVLTGQIAQLGFVYLLQFTAILSINLAVINILPFPALDGGRLLFLTIEKIKGIPVSQKLENAIHTAGFMLLIILLLVVTFKDIARLDILNKVIKLFT